MLAQTVDGIPKRQWSREDLIELFGPAFEIFGEPLQCSEIVDSGDADGVRAA